MSSCVGREVLLDAADVGNLLQITVEFLIGDYRHQLTVEIFAFILFQYLDGGRKQGNSNLCVGFLTMGDYPQPPVKHLLDVVNTQVGKVDVCQSGKKRQINPTTYGLTRRRNFPTRITAIPT